MSVCKRTLLKHKSRRALGGEVLVYLKSIKAYFSNDDDFNWSPRAIAGGLGFMGFRRFRV